MKIINWILVLLLAGAGFDSCQAADRDLRVGRAFHAFDHLGNIGEQSEAAAHSGVNIIYATGLGSLGYQGLPAPDELERQKASVKQYNARARQQGIRVILGYLCATSIIKLDSFDVYWSADFRSRFGSSPSTWRQVGRDGAPLPSWYGGDYQPACMNNPDWQNYEKFMVSQQLLTGHDGIFFDNPTVHPKGCYCRFCMDKFARFLRAGGIRVTNATTEEIRKLADAHPREFLHFRSTTARDFLEEMRTHARRIQGNALVTCNNSLNAPGVLFSQARTYGYSILEKSKAEDFVVVEDMSHQPRMLKDSSTREYGPTYRQLAAISHGKPIVAVTIADADYHTPPNLVKLAMAEAAAHGASYLAWPTWPAEQRLRMAAAIRPQANLLAGHESLLNGTRPRTDALLLLPHRRWLETNHCTASDLAAVLTRHNIQYRVVEMENLGRELKKFSGRRNLAWKRPDLILESLEVLDPGSREAMEKFQKSGGRTIVASKGDLAGQLKDLSRQTLSLSAPVSVRAVVQDLSGKCVVHLYNLNIRRESSFEDVISPATDLEIRVHVPFKKPAQALAVTADLLATMGPVQFDVAPAEGGAIVTARLARLDIHTLLVISR